MQNKRFILILLTLFILSISVYALSSSTMTAPTSAENITGNIVLNVTTDAPADNVSISWIDYTNGTVMLQTMIYNDTVNDTVFENISFPTTLLPDGIYNISVNATNSSNASVVNETANYVTVDNSNPNVLNITSPLANQNITSGNSVFLNVTVNDTWLDVVTMQFLVYNGSENLSYDGSASSANTWYYNLNTTGLTIGAHTLFILANDTVGNSNGTESVNFNIVVSDAAYPSVAFNNPSIGDNFSIINHGSDLIQINVTANDTVEMDTVRVVVSNVSENLTFSASNSTSNWWTYDLNMSLLEDGNHTITILANDTSGNMNGTESISILVDNTAPIELSAPTIFDTDGFLITGHEFNISTTFFDILSEVQNVTFYLNNICSGVTVISTAFASCTVDANQDFNPVNITYTVCDTLDNCDSSFYYTVTNYNYTFPDDDPDFAIFNRTYTTNLSAQSDLNDVDYTIALDINGSKLPGTPWVGFLPAGKAIFYGLNFTDPSVYDDLINLQYAINLTTKNPKGGAYGGTRLYVNTSAFAALDTLTYIEIYNFHFSSNALKIYNDSGQVDGINKTYTPNAGGTGNLSFYVNGFSGYNMTDDVDPVIVINSPDNNSVIVTNQTFNFTFNATGTEINNQTINLTIINSTGSTSYYNFSNMTCSLSNNNEIMDCYAIIVLQNDTYNFSITAADYGGVAGNSLTTTYVNLTFAPAVDSTAPTTTIISPINWTNDNETFAYFNITDETDNNISYTLSLTVDATNTTNSSSSTVISGVINSFNLSSLLFNQSELSDGNYSLIIESTDSSNNSANSSRVYFYLDTVLPNITSFTLSDTTATKNQEVTGTCVANDTQDQNVTIVITGIDTSTTGDKIATCTATDDAGNEATRNVTYNVRSTSSSSSSSSSTSTTPSVSVSKAAIWSKIEKYQHANMSISSDEIGLTKISVKVNKVVTNVQMTVKKLSAKPSSAKNISRKVYKYIEIENSNLANSDISGLVKIEFKVSREWLTNNSMSAERIVLKRYVDNKWVDLITDILRSDLNYYYFDTSTPGFSYFAIGEVDIDEEVEVIVEETVNETLEEETEEEPPMINLGTEDDEPEVPELDVEFESDKVIMGLSRNSVLWGIFTIVTIIIIVVVFIFEGKKIKGLLHHEKMKEHEVHEPHDNHGKLDDFVNKSLEHGHSAEEIKAALLKVGWKEELVDASLKKHSGPSFMG